MSLQKGSLCFPFCMERAELFKKLNEGIIDERFHLFQNNVVKNKSLIDQFGGLRDIVPLLRGKDVILQEPDHPLTEKWICSVKLFLSAMSSYLC